MRLWMHLKNFIGKKKICNSTLLTPCPLFSSSPFSPSTTYCQSGNDTTTNCDYLRMFVKSNKIFWQWLFYLFTSCANRVMTLRQTVIIFEKKSKGLAAESKAKKRKKESSDLGATLVGWLPTYIDHIAQVTPKSDKVNIQKLTLNDEGGLGESGVNKSPFAWRFYIRQSQSLDIDIFWDKYLPPW